MRDRNDRLLRDAIRKADWMEISWRNGVSSGSFTTMDGEFAKDVANAFARYCDRMEQQLNGNGEFHRH